MKLLLEYIHLLFVVFGFSLSILELVLQHIVSNLGLIVHQAVQVTVFAAFLFAKLLNTLFTLTSRSVHFFELQCLGGLVHERHLLEYLASVEWEILFSYTVKMVHGSDFVTEIWEYLLDVAIEFIEPLRKRCNIESQARFGMN